MDFRGDPSVLPPEQHYREMATRVSDLVLSRSYTELAKLMTASHAQLVRFARAGTAYTLRDGTIVAGTNPSQVSAAVLSARAANGNGGPCDDPKFRAWLEGRCEALGMNAPEWSGADSVGTAGGQGSGSLSSDPGGARPADGRIARYDGRTGTAGKGLMTDVRIPVGSTITTPNGDRYNVMAHPGAARARAEAFIKAAEYDEMAGNLALDSKTRESYRQLAAKTRRTS